MTYYCLFHTFVSLALFPYLSLSLSFSLSLSLTCKHITCFSHYLTIVLPALSLSLCPSVPLSLSLSLSLSFLPPFSLYHLFSSSPFALSPSLFLLYAFLLTLAVSRFIFGLRSWLEDIPSNFVSFWNGATTCSTTTLSIMTECWAKCHLCQVSCMLSVVKSPLCWVLLCWVSCHLFNNFKVIA